MQSLNKIQLPGAARDDIARVRGAVTAFFAIDGFIFASWAVRIPAVKVAAHASSGTLGLALLGLSGGAVATMTISGALCRRFGAPRMIVANGLLLALALLLPPLARSPLWLGLALAAFGIGYGGLNVSMNSLAVDLVAVLRRPVMPYFHSAWSFGGLLGAGLGGLLAPHLAPLPHLALVAAMGLAVTAVCGRTILSHPVVVRPAVQVAAQPAVQVAVQPAVQVAARPVAEASAREERPLGRGSVWRVVLVFGLIAACASYGEGAIGDWGALHLRQDLGAGPGLAAAGYAAFALAEASGRLAGSWLLSRLGQTRVLAFGGLTACLGMLAAALAPSIGLALAGFALTGLGVANMFPAAMTRAGLLAGANGVAIASTLGYAGFLLGPPVIGFLAASVSVGTGLTTVSFLALVATLLACLEDRLSSQAFRLLLLSSSRQASGRTGRRSAIQGGRRPVVQARVRLSRAGRAPLPGGRSAARRALHCQAGAPLPDGRSASCCYPSRQGSGRIVRRSASCCYPIRRRSGRRRR